MGHFYGATIDYSAWLQTLCVHIIIIVRGKLGVYHENNTGQYVNNIMNNFNMYNYLKHQQK